MTNMVLSLMMLRVHSINMICQIGPVLEFFLTIKTEFVFVSSDRDQSAFDGYHAEMPFLALPYSQRDLKTELSNKLYVFHSLVSFLSSQYLYMTTHN